MQTYALLNLTDLRLGLEDLLTVRRGPLFRTQSGKAYEGVLELQRQAINALPAPLTGGRPFAEELALRNADHDAFGLGIWHMTEAYLRIPGIEPEIVAAVHRIREAFVPDPERVRDAYADQALAVASRRENMVTLADDLVRIPIAGGSTLFDWVAGFIGAGEHIAKILAQRAEINANTRKHAMTLHTDTIRGLNELRRAIADEIARTMGMPRTVEGEVFGYLDMLEANRLEAKQAVPGSVSTPSTQVISPVPSSNRGYSAIPASQRSAGPGSSSNPPAPSSPLLYSSAPTSNRGSRNI